MYDGLLLFLEHSRKPERVHSIKEILHLYVYHSKKFTAFFECYNVCYSIQCFVCFLHCLTQEDRRGENTEYKNIKPQS